MAAENNKHTWLIIGAGVFGVSTALTLSQRYPNAHITLVDRAAPGRFTASWDWSKIIRADYADVLYARLALEAKKLWREGPLYREFYHETGLVWMTEAEDADYLDGVTSNFEKLGGRERWRMVPTQELRAAHDGVFANTDFGAKQQVYVNYSSGWVDASKTMEKVLAAAMERGVHFREGNVDHLLFGEKGACTGVRVDGEVLTADNVILATGAETPRLLAESAPERPEMHAGDRISAAGLITAFVRQGNEAAEKSRSAPAFLYADGMRKGDVIVSLCIAWSEADCVVGGIIPSGLEDRLKVTSDVSTKNTVEILPGSFVSLPPVNPDLIYSSMQEDMKKELDHVLEGFTGIKAHKATFEGYCLCW
jgi:sarcosine oxidase/L-pipecolate oxidase